MFQAVVTSRLRSGLANNSRMAGGSQSGPPAPAARFRFRASSALEPPNRPRFRLARSIRAHRAVISQNKAGMFFGISQLSLAGPLRRLVRRVSAERADTVTTGGRQAARPVQNKAGISCRINTESLWVLFQAELGPARLEGGRITDSLGAWHPPAIHLATTRIRPPIGLSRRVRSRRVVRPPDH
jgi:hypothetical protein